MWEEEPDHTIKTPLSTDQQEVLYEVELLLQGAKKLKNEDLNREAYGPCFHRYKDMAIMQMCYQNGLAKKAVVDMMTDALKSSPHWRVLSAIEQGMRNHHVVPTQLVESLSGLRRGGVYKALKSLVQSKLVVREIQTYEGYRLTFMGYDYLAIRAMVKRGSLIAIGRKLGVGKESDVYHALTAEGVLCCLKLHRLGTTAFRQIKNKRDYVATKSVQNWLYVSKLSAMKEKMYMEKLSKLNFPTPKLLDHCRHAVLMSYIPGKPFSSIKELKDYKTIYRRCMKIIIELAKNKLIHCDFNEFNLMVDEVTGDLTMIDFPQMCSTDHQDAKMYFDRDVEGVVTWFKKKYRYELENIPQLNEILENGDFEYFDSFEKEEWTPLARKRRLKRFEVHYQLHPEGMDEDLEKIKIPVGFSNVIMEGMKRLPKEEIDEDMMTEDGLLDKEALEKEEAHLQKQRALQSESGKGISEDQEKSANDLLSEFLDKRDEEDSKVEQTEPLQEMKNEEIPELEPIAVSKPTDVVSHILSSRRRNITPAEMRKRVKKKQQKKKRQKKSKSAAKKSNRVQIKREMREYF